MRWPAGTFTATLTGALAGTLADLTDLVLPATCAGCETPGGRLTRGVCARCALALLRLAPSETRPDPAPAGLPAVVALGPYEGPLRSVLLAYKERGRHRLAAPLGALLAEAVSALVPAGNLLLVPVPSTARAVRQRQGDHLAGLARHAAARLRGAGRAVTVIRPVRALPRTDSAGLGVAERVTGAEHGFRPRATHLCRARRAAAGARAVVLDDIITTGATIAAVTRTLDSAGLPVYGAAVLAATRRRRPPTHAVRAIRSGQSANGDGSLPGGKRR